MANDLTGLLTLAATQQGCFNRNQWRQHGLSDSRLDRSLATGWVIQVHQRVFRLTGMPSTWLSRVHAATLISPGNVFAGGLTGLALHGVSERRDRRPHVTIPHDLRYTFDRRLLVVHSSRTLAHDTATVVNGIPAVSVDRSLFEIGMLDPGSGWLDLVSEAARRRLVTPASMAEALEVMGPIPHFRRMRDALGTLDDRFVHARSVPEVPLAHLVEEVTGHSAVLNHAVADSDGTVFARVDVAVPDLRLGFEGDSVRWHGAGTRQHHDRVRDDQYKVARWTVGRVMLSWLRTDLVFRLVIDW